MKLLILLLSVLLVSGNQNLYRGYKVFRLRPTTEVQNELLSELENDKEGKYDFWTGLNNAKLSVDVMVAPKDQENFINIIESNGIGYDIMTDNVQNKIEKAQIQDNLGAGMSWNKYYSLDAIYEWMDSLPQEHPGKVEVIEMGYSHENRPIKGVKIATGPTEKRAVMIESGIHAREWIAPATATYIINELLNSEDPNIKKLTESLDWYIFPTVNPDGYAFTAFKDRLWKKNRKPSQYCLGADLNRNFEYKWGVIGASENPCDSTYAGSAAFSEPESLALAKFTGSIADKLVAYLAFHSYSQMLLIPYADSKQQLDNYNDLKTIGYFATIDLKSRHGTRYGIGTAAELLHPVSGSSVDWVKASYKIPITYTYEMRDRGDNGFFLPEEQIIPNAEEVLQSFVAMFKMARNKRYF